jgi:hypothetical protein
MESFNRIWMNLAELLGLKGAIFERWNKSLTTFQHFSAAGTGFLI